MTASLLRKLAGLGALPGLLLAPAAASAQEEGDMLGWAVDGQIGFMESVTPTMDSIVSFHDGLLMWIITIIVLVVLGLLLWVIVRYNARANPTPSRTTHNTLVEIVWTVAPIIILIVIAIPSFGVLADQMTVPDGERRYLGADIFSFGDVEVPEPEITIKATGYEWNWGYEYMDNDEAGFLSFMLDENERDELKPGQPRLLAVDNEMVVPVDTTVRMQVTANAVIHAFAVPSFGIKVDAVPGRLNETWFHARRTGIYYGQCSELCGINHAYMPIAVRVVTQEQYATWIAALETEGVDAANATLPPLQ